jgi:hypothetical protein
MATTLAVAGNVDFNGDLDVDGTTNLDVVDIDGAVDMASTLTVAGDANFDSNTLFVDVSANNVGIGTASPARKLDVNGSGIVRGFMTLYGTGTDNALFLHNTAYEWAAYTNASNYFVIEDWNLNQKRLVIDTSGNVGIGTVTPGSFDAEANNLVVGSGSGDEGITIFTGSSVGDYGSIFFGDATGTPKQGQIRYEQNNEVMSFYTNASEKMQIDLNGHVGIGTSSPLTTLTIAETAGNTALTFQQTNNGTTNWLIGAQYTASNTFEITPSTAVGGHKMAISYNWNVSHCRRIPNRRRTNRRYL